MVRSLMKIPAVRRVMRRLANAEAAITGHEAQLTALGDVMQRLSADEANQRALLAEVAQHMPPARRTALEAKIHEQQGELAALSATIPTQQAELGTLTATTREQQSQLGAITDRVQQLSALLGEVSQHLPPAQRANLETTLHGQQLQLGALNATMHANQIQLGALNDIVERLSAEARSQRELLADVSVQQPARRSGTPQPSQRPGEGPYTFDQLLNRQVEPFGPDLVFHVHIPKTAGTTLKTLFQQNNFWLLDFDMNTQSFFGDVPENRWWQNFLREPPRKPYLLSGHFRLDLPILRQLQLRHAIVTLLREPMQRVLSHYNYTIRTAGNPHREEVLSGTMSFLDYAEWLHRAIGPQYSFFDDSGAGTFARSGTASVERCLSNLLTKVSLFGLTERFNEYCALVGYLLGRSRVLAVGAENVTASVPAPHNGAMKDSLSTEELDGVNKLFADDIWFYEEARKEYERRTSDPRLRAVLSETLPLIAECDDVMERLDSIRDPANPERGAFTPVKE